MGPCSAAAAKSLQSCPTLGNPIDGGPPGSPVPGILQARILEWVAISFPQAMLSKSLIQFSVDGWGCVSSLLFDLRPNYGGVNEGNGDLLHKVSAPALAAGHC